MEPDLESPATLSRHRLLITAEKVDELQVQLLEAAEAAPEVAVASDESARFLESGAVQIGW